MTPTNDSNPAEDNREPERRQPEDNSSHKRSDDKNSHDEKRASERPHSSDRSDDEFDNLVKPSFIPSYNRRLVDTYMEMCRHSLGQSATVITSLREMSSEDKQNVSLLDLLYRKFFAERLKALGLDELRNEIHLRMLHPVVVVHGLRRSYHLYADAVADNGRCCLVDVQSIGVLNRGPAATRVTAFARLKPNTQEPPRFYLEFAKLLSKPAYHEAMHQLIAATRDEIFESPKEFLGFGWIIQAIERYQEMHRKDAGSGAKSGASSSTKSSKIKDFGWTGQRRPYTFECVIADRCYRIEIGFSQVHRNPTMAVAERKL